ncbi:MAG: ATP-binding protein, partial [Chloroflexota bacterium]
AIKFTEKGKIEIVIDSNGHQAISDAIIFKVTDTGVGIPDDQTDAVFTRFNQTDMGIRIGKGTGLGMPINKTLAEMHGGTLTFDSKVNVGTTFTLVIPRHQSN